MYFYIKDVSNFINIVTFYPEFRAKCARIRFKLKIAAPLHGEISNTFPTILECNRYFS